MVGSAHPTKTMTLTLRLKTASSVPLEVEGITPEVLRDKSLAEIEKLDMFQGNVKTPLAEFFDVSGDPSDGLNVWEGDLSGVHWIGTEMTEGQIRIAGDGGRHIGSEMRGGRIDVEGNTGDWLGGEMHGGTICVRGNAGHQVGAAYRGSPRGMDGGTILVHGNAGNEIGHTLRRGLIAIGGDIGDLAGFNMLAGSILLFGRSGIRHGAGMRRGTIGFFSPEPPPLLPTFRFGNRYRPEFLQLLLRELRNLDFPVPDELFNSTVDLYHGDLIEGGRGEILIQSAA